MALDLPQEGDLDWDTKLNQLFSSLDTRLAAIEALFPGVTDDITAAQADIAALQTTQAALATTVDGKLDKAGTDPARWWAPSATLPSVANSQEGDMIIKSTP